MQVWYSSRDTEALLIYVHPVERGEEEMVKKWPQKCGDLSFFLGGRRPGDDDDNWGPCLAAVDAAIAFARSTGRMEMELAP